MGGSGRHRAAGILAAACVVHFVSADGGGGGSGGSVTRNFSRNCSGLAVAMGVVGCRKQQLHCLSTYTSIALRVEPTGRSVFVWLGLIAVSM